MPKSRFVERLDEVQTSLTALLKPLAFRRKGRTYNRSVEDGVVQVINLQTGPYEVGQRNPLPPELAHLQQDLYGRFTVNLGVHVREVWECDSTSPWPKTIQEYSCQIRTRLGRQAGQEYWWSLDQSAQTLSTDVAKVLLGEGVEFLERFETRDAILDDWVTMNDGNGRLSKRARVDVAIMLAKRGQSLQAAHLLNEQIQLSSENQGHLDYVRSIGQKLGLTELLE
jgi:hypothetical protein